MKLTKNQLIKLILKMNKKKGIGAPKKPIIPPKNSTVGIPAPIKPKLVENIDFSLNKKREP